MRQKDIRDQTSEIRKQWHETSGREKEKLENRKQKIGGGPECRVKSQQGLGGEEKRRDSSRRPVVSDQRSGNEDKMPTHPADRGRARRVQLREGFWVKQSEGDLERRRGGTGTLWRLMQCHGKGAGDRGKQ